MSLFSTLGSIGSGLIGKVGSKLLDFGSKALGDIGGKVLGSLGSSAVDFGSNWLGNKFIGKDNAETAYKQSQTATAESWDRTHGAYKSRYQDTMNDMQDAGLNPILAASGGFNVGSGPTANTAQAFQASSPNYNASASAAQMAQADKSKAETSESQIRQKKIVQETINLVQLLAKSKGETGKIAQETLNLMRTYQKLSIEIKKITAETVQQETKAKAYKLLQFPIKGWSLMGDLRDDKHLKSDIIRGLVGAGSRANKAIINIKNDFSKKIQQMKNFLNNGYDLPSSPKIGD